MRLAVLGSAALLLVGGGFGGFAYWKLNSNIKSVDVDTLLGNARPPVLTNGDFNPLLGSDSRAGANRKKAGGATDGTARSDTAMVVHIAKDHKHASVVSIPRDTLVDRPECTKADGRTVPAASRAMFNSAFEVGGAACAVKTAESVTGLRMNHFVEIDFAGFAGFVDAIGGVTVTTAIPIDDKQSGLELAAGTDHLSGDRALAFVRTRHGVGDGSDLGRIPAPAPDAQVHPRTRRRAWGCWPTRSGSTPGLRHTDPGASRPTPNSASVNSLMGLAQTLKAIGPDQLTLVTLPVESPRPSTPTGSSPGSRTRPRYGRH